MCVCVGEESTYIIPSLESLVTPLPTAFLSGGIEKSTDQIPVQQLPCIRFSAKHQGQKDGTVEPAIMELTVCSKEESHMNKKFYHNTPGRRGIEYLTCVNYFAKCFI